MHFLKSICCHHLTKYKFRYNAALLSDGPVASCVKKLGQPPLTSGLCIIGHGCHNLLSEITGITIAIGAVMDESIVDKYICKRHCAVARKVLVVEWITMGFLLSISYKSVLLANMMTVKYEDGINTIDDMINSKKPLLVIRSMKPLFVTDLRPNIIELSKQVQYYDFDMFKKVPQWAIKGYAFYAF